MNIFSVLPVMISWDYHLRHWRNICKFPLWLLEEQNIFDIFAGPQESTQFIFTLFTQKLHTVHFKFILPHCNNSHSITSFGTCSTYSTKSGYVVTKLLLFWSVVTGKYDSLLMQVSLAIWYWCTASFHAVPNWTLSLCNASMARQPWKVYSLQISDDLGQRSWVNRQQKSSPQFPLLVESLTCDWWGSCIKTRRTVWRVICSGWASREISKYVHRGNSEITTNYYKIKNCFSRVFFFLVCVSMFWI